MCFLFDLLHALCVILPTPHLLHTLPRIPPAPFAGGSALVPLVAGLLAVLSTLPAPSGRQDQLAVLSYLIAFLALAFLLPMLILLYSYARAGVWIEADRVRVQFPGENEQEMAWSEARFAVNEGEEYLRASKGKEGLGHVFGDTRYI